MSVDLVNLQIRELTVSIIQLEREIEKTPRAGCVLQRQWRDLRGMKQLLRESLRVEGVIL